MKKRYQAMMLGMFGSLLLSTAVFAADVETPDFNALDVNQDGTLSATEAAASPELSQNWSDIDKDENGAIDEAEFSAFESMQQSEPAGSKD